MATSVREFRQRHGRSAERFWQTWLEDDFVCTVWGAVADGKRKEHGRTKDRPGPKGQKGTKAYVDSYANAQFNLERDIRKKTEEGYIEVDEKGQPLAGKVVQATIDHGERLPKNLCFSKPRNKVNGDFIVALEQKDDLTFTRKVNGMTVIAQRMADGEVVLYSRRMDVITDHFPHLVDAITDMIPFCSIQMFEGFMGAGNTKRDLNKCSEIMRCKHAAKALQRQRELGWMKFYLYRIPFWKAQHLESKYTCAELAQMIENSLGDKFAGYRDKPDRAKGQFLYTLETFEGSVKEAMALAEKEDYEGWVCYQSSAIIGDYSFSFDGKAHRPACAFKMKRAATDDFRAYWNPDEGTKERPLGTWGTGKNMGKLGTLSLYQLNSKGEEVYIADCSGFTDEERERLGKLKKWPICVEVKFDSRFYKSQGDKTNSLDFPRYQRERSDKTCEECIDEDL